MDGQSLLLLLSFLLAGLGVARLFAAAAILSCLLLPPISMQKKLMMMRAIVLQLSCLASSSSSSSAQSQCFVSGPVFEADDGGDGRLNCSARQRRLGMTDSPKLLPIPDPNSFL
jgi:hypothetical protein